VYPYGSQPPSTASASVTKIVDDLPLLFALRRLPEYNLAMVAGSVGRALLISHEMEPDPRKVVHAALLRSIQDSASDSVGSDERRG
jgi:hypothetical protein